MIQCTLCLYKTLFFFLPKSTKKEKDVVISETQAKDIESSGNANAVLPKPVQKPPAKGNCYYCGESWPHNPTTGSQVN